MPEAFFATADRAPEDAAPLAGDSLRAVRAARADPVGQHFLAALAEHAATADAALMNLPGGDAAAEPKKLLASRLRARLALATAAFAERFAQAEAEAGAALAAVGARHPAAADELQALFAAGDFGGLRRRIAGLAMHARREAWAGLVAARVRAQTATLAGSSGAVDAGSMADAISLPGETSVAGEWPVGEWPPGGLPVGGAAGESREGALAAGDLARRLPAPDEPKAFRHFRDTWIRLAAERQLAAALAEVPANAGPLNAQLLVQRALMRMHGISPDCLVRFLAWAEGLQWLEAGAEPEIPAKKAKSR